MLYGCKTDGFFVNLIKRKLRDPATTPVSARSGQPEEAASALLYFPPALSCQAGRPPEAAACAPALQRTGQSNRGRYGEQVSYHRVRAIGQIADGGSIR